MQDFQEKIANIALRMKQISDERLFSPELNESSSNLKEVMNILYSRTELGVDIYNGAIKRGELSIFRLPAEVLRVFLNLPRNQIGFCLMSEVKFVVFIGDVPDEILVLGKKRQSSGGGEPLVTRATQLIRIKFEHSGKIYRYVDNTGSSVDPDEIIVHVIGWAVK